MSSSGSITSLEVQGLASDTHYFFKLGASTEVGPGPYTPVKDVHTPLPQYGMFCTSYTDTDDGYTHSSILYRCVHPVLRVTGVQDLGQQELQQ